MGKLIGPKDILHAKEQFGVVDDEKLKMTIVAMADKYTQGIRELVYRAYNDPYLASIYHGWRLSKQFDHGGKSKIHKEIVRFPNGHVFDFVDTVLTAIYGPEWMKNNKALRHELVRPWWIVNSL